MSILRIVQYTELKFRILFNNRYHYSKDQPIDCCNSSLENLVTLFMQTSILQTPNTKIPLLSIQLPSKHPNISRFYYACNSTRVSKKVFKTNQQVSNSGDGKLSQTRTYSGREILSVYYGFFFSFQHTINIQVLRNNVCENENNISCE